MAIVIQTENLQKAFHGKVVLQDIDIAVHSGTIFGFLGPNGAGKTTTIRLLNGLLNPTGGTITVLGKPIPEQSAAVRQLVGVQTDTNLYEMLSARLNLSLWGQLFGMSPKKAEQRADLLLEQFGLAERRLDLVGTFSKGMKQKVAIARALIHEPTILYLDEPTAGLDPEASEDILNYLGQYVTKSEHTVFLSSHRLEEVQRLCDQVALIDKGKIKAQGKVQALLKEYFPEHEVTITVVSVSPVVSKVVKKYKATIHNKSITVTMSDSEKVPALVSALVRAGANILSVEPKRPTLTDLYLKIMPKSQYGLV